jgi:hypothetical protein
MKRHIIEHLMLALIVSAFTIREGCQQPSQSTMQPLEPSSPTPSTPAPSSPIPSPQANLRITDVRVGKSNLGNEHRFIAVDVKNNGDGIARGFDVVCNWNCPPGDSTISMGTHVVQGGYISGSGQFTYTTHARIGCIGPPAVLNVECIISPKGKHGQAKWSGKINIPF